MDSNVLEAILSAAVPVVVALLGVLSAKIVTFLNAKRDEIKTKSKNDTIKSYIDLVHDNTVNIVQGLNQTLVENLKAASEDGKLTEDDAIKIKNEALNLLMDTLSEDIKITLASVFGDTTTYLNNLIDRVVCELKKNTQPKG